MRSLLMILPALALLSVTPPPPPEAPSASAPAPTPAEDWTIVTCDGNLLVEYGKNQATFYRNVQVKNPKGCLRADRLVIYFSPRGKKAEKAEAFGSVWVKMGERIGTAEKMEYYPPEKKTILLGKARIDQKDGSVKGEKITFFLDRKEMQVEGAPAAEQYPEKEFDIKF